MKTIELKLYSFDELSEKVKEKVLKEFQFINVEFNWWEQVYEDAKSIGLHIDSFDTGRNRHAKGAFIQDAIYTAESIKLNHGIDCKTYKTAEKFLNKIKGIEGTQWRENDTYIVAEETFIEELLNDYSIILENECEYLQSKEAVLETIDANNYTFEENGKMRNI